MRWVSMVFISYVLSGCTYQYTLSQTEEAISKANLVDQHRITSLRNLKITPANTLYVVLADGNILPQHRSRLLDCLQTAFAAHYSQLTVVPAPYSKNEAIAMARRANAGMLVYVQPAKVVEKHSSFAEVNAGIESYADIGFDRAELLINLWDVHSDLLVNSTLLSSRTTFFQFASHEADSLFDAMLQGYVNSITVVR